MTISPNKLMSNITIKTLGCLGYAIGLAWFINLGSSTVILAEMNKPIRLAPVIRTVQPEVSRPSSWPENTANPSGRILSKRITGGRVEVDTLKSVDINEIGTLTSKTGALGGRMWRGTSGAMVERLIDKLPTHAPSAAMRKLMRKLLLSPAAAPKGVSNPNGLISMRFTTLVTIGALDDASKLFEILPSTRVAELTAIEADLRFLANDNARACELAEQEMIAVASAFWQKAFTFCSVLKGEKEKAQLSLSLMRELGEEDKTFLILADRLISKEKIVLSEMINPSPLHLAMSRVGNVQLPGSVISSNTPSILSAIAMSPKASMELRLEAGERADVAGALPVDVLRQMYTNVNFSKEDLANPLSRAEIEFGPMVRALLFRTSLAQTVPIAQAEATARAFILARDEGRYMSTVRVFWPVLKRIPPSNELLWFAPEALRALLLVGDIDAALPWYQVLQAGAIRNGDAKKAMALFSPLAYLFEFNMSEGQNEEQLGQLWWSAMQNEPEAEAKAVLLFTLLEALGVKISEKSWEPLIDTNSRSQKTMPNLALLTRLQVLTANAKMMDQLPSISTNSITAKSSLLNASNLTPSAPINALTRIQGAAVNENSLVSPMKSKRVGEIVLLSLLAIGDVGPAKIEVGVLSTVLRALLAVGLDQDARALAIEAALANGL
jgi:hypothetical protein